MRPLLFLYGLGLFPDMDTIGMGSIDYEFNSIASDEYDNLLGIYHRREESLYKEHMKSKNFTKPPLDSLEDLEKQMDRRIRRVKSIQSNSHAPSIINNEQELLGEIINTIDKGKYILTYDEEQYSKNYHIHVENFRNTEEYINWNREYSLLSIDTYNRVRQDMCLDPLTTAEGKVVDRELIDTLI